MKRPSLSSSAPVKGMDEREAICRGGSDKRVALDTPSKSKVVVLTVQCRPGQEDFSALHPSGRDSLLCKGRSQGRPRSVQIRPKVSTSTTYRPIPYPGGLPRPAWGPGESVECPQHSRHPLIGSEVRGMPPPPSRRQEEMEGGRESRKKKRVPQSVPVSNCSSPPSASASRRAMDSPRPLPEKKCPLRCSDFLNGA